MLRSASNGHVNMAILTSSSHMDGYVNGFSCHKKKDNGSGISRMRGFYRYIHRLGGMLRSGSNGHINMTIIASSSHMDGYVDGFSCHEKKDNGSGIGRMPGLHRYVW
jgi:hypothetical protein